MNGRIPNIEACYRDTGVTRYAGNPLIDALPPIWSPDDAEAADLEAAVADGRGS